MLERFECTSLAKKALHKYSFFPFLSFSLSLSLLSSPSLSYYSLRSSHLPFSSHPILPVSFIFLHFLSPYLLQFPNANLKFVTYAHPAGSSAIGGCCLRFLVVYRHMLHDLYGPHSQSGESFGGGLSM